MELRADFCDKNSTGAIKGIALILMFIHHFFTFPEWYVESVSIPSMQNIAPIINAPTRICVAIFAFITGYGFYLSSDKSLKRSLKKISQFLIRYWIVYGVILAISCVLVSDYLNMSDCLWELLGLKKTIMIFGWYVYFYIIVMLFLPVLHKLCKENTLAVVAVGMIIPIILLSFVYGFATEKMVMRAARDVKDFLPVVIVGYICSSKKIFLLWDRWFAKRNQGYIFKIVMFVIPLVMLALRHFYTNSRPIVLNVFQHEIGIFVNLDVIYAPIVVFCLYELLNEVKYKCSAWTKMILLNIGKYSVYMWFWHCIFFNVCKEYTQKYLFITNNPLIVLMWGLTLCLGLAVVSDCVYKKIATLLL